jgi:hypothetical protein
MIATGREMAGQTIDWPHLRSNDGIRQPHDYPQGILDEAAVWWEKLSAAERSRLMSELQQERRQRLEDRLPSLLLEYTFEPNNPSEWYFLGVSLLIAYRVAFRSKPDDPATEVSAAVST